MRKILVLGTGLCCYKFVLSIRDQYTREQVFLTAFSSPYDVISDLSYLVEVDELIHCDNETYEDIDQIIQHCSDHDIDAVFPGHGVLSEDSMFVEKLEDHNIIFMGPSIITINLLVDKFNGMFLAEEVGAPTISWYQESILINEKSVLDAALSFGFPLMLKDAYGYDGKGFRIVRNKEEVIPAYYQIMDEMSRNEGEGFFFLMELMEEYRSIEIQVAGDGKNAMHFYGRDCTIQYNGTNIVQEAPIACIPDEIVQWCEDSSVKIAQKVSLCGLGTVVFLYSHKDNKITFSHVKPSIQPQHLVTDYLLDINLHSILYKLTCEKLSLSTIFDKLDLPKPNKFVVATQLCAENKHNTMEMKTVETVHVPKILHGWSYVSLLNGGNYLQYHDLSIAHLLTVGNTREQACRRMSIMINDTDIQGDVETNLSFLKNIIDNKTFRNNQYNNTYYKNGSWLNSRFEKHQNSYHKGLSDLFSLSKPIQRSDVSWIIGLFALAWWKHKKLNKKIKLLSLDSHSITDFKKVFVNIQVKHLCVEAYAHFTKERDKIFSRVDLVFDNIHCVSFSVKEIRNDLLFIFAMKKRFRVEFQNCNYQSHKIQITINSLPYTFHTSESSIYSPLYAKVVNIFKDVENCGHHVAELECMNMDIPIVHPSQGKIHWCVEKGDIVEEGQVLGNLNINNYCNYDITEILPSGMYTKWKDNSSLTLDNFNLRPIDYVSMLSVFDWRLLRRICDDTVWTRNEFDMGYVNNEMLFDVKTFETGIVGFLLEGNNPFVMIIHHAKRNNIVFEEKECSSFYHASKLARVKGIPRVYLSRTMTSASLSYEPELLGSLIFEKNGTIKINRFHTEKWKHIIEYNEDTFEVQRIKHTELEFIQGSFDIVRETLVAYDSIPTFTYISGFSHGIGGYLARLGHRVIQRKEESQLLTKYMLLNQLLGQDSYLDGCLYDSHTSQNGVCQRLVESDIDAAENIRTWLDIIKQQDIIHLECPPNSSFYGFENVPSSLIDLSKVLDNGRCFKTMDHYAKFLFTGRAYINEKAYSVVTFNPETMRENFKIPLQGTLSNGSNKKIRIFDNGSINKFVETIRDSNRERLPLFILANWGFTYQNNIEICNNFNEYFNMISNAMSEYKQTIWIYIPQNCHLEKNLLSLFNTNDNINILADPNANICFLNDQIKIVKCEDIRSYL